MEKIRINLDILLPEAIGERDACIKRITEKLSFTRGVLKVHIVPGQGRLKGQLCFHYDPQIISVARIEEIAKKEGADILQKFGHIFYTVSGIRNISHARNLEFALKSIKGILFVSTTLTGFIQIEYEKDIININEISKSLIGHNLKIVKVEDYRGLNNEYISSDKSINIEVASEEQTESNELHSKHSDHNHNHTGIFGKNTELIFSIICGFFFALGFILSFFKNVPNIILYISFGISYLTGGYYAFKEALQGVLNGNFEIDFLMIVAAIGAAVLGHYAEGCLLLFLFSLGHSLEHFALEKAKKSIASLSDLTPSTALLKIGNDVSEVAIETLVPGNIILVRPDTKIAADGIVISGSGNVNQAPITGESKPVNKSALDDVNFDIKNESKTDIKFKVFAGSINGSSSLEVMVSKLSSNSTIARLIKLVNEAQTQKSTTQNFTDKVERYYVPAVLIFVSLLLFVFMVRDETFGQSFYRAMAVLVAASPCALAIATPSTVLSGVARAAKRGILIKGGKPLEHLGLIDVIAFDKTGTLTEGKPRLKEIFPLQNFDKISLMKIVSAVESHSDHPLAAAIVKGLKETHGIVEVGATDVKSIVGMGVSGQYNGSEIFIGNTKLFQTNNFLIEDKDLNKVSDLEAQGYTTMFVGKDLGLIGIVALVDTPREDAKSTIESLGKLGIKKMIMLSGDNQKVADNIAQEIGINEAWGSLMPEQKISSIQLLLNQGNKVAMVGDGVNDAPAMATSNVGIAMGAAGSDVALETADVALLADKLTNLSFAIALGRKARSIIKQNLFISIGMVFILVPLTLFGFAKIGPAVIAHEGSTLVVVFNALRLLGFKEKA